MATKRRKSRPSSRPSHTITVSKLGIALTHIIIGALYFFCYFFVPNAPLFGLIQEIWRAIVGELGLMISMWLGFVLWLLYLKKDQNIISCVKRSAGLMFFVSTLLNGSAVEQDPLPYLQQWWYISRPLVQLLKMAFGADPMALQSVSILAILIIWWILIYQLNVTALIPSFNVQYQQPEKDQQQWKKSPLIRGGGEAGGVWTVRNSKPETRDQEESSWSILDIFKRSPKLSASQEINNKEEFTTSNHLYTRSLENPTEIKDFVKSKVAEKLWITQPEKEIPKVAMTFGWDVPTYPLRLLTAPDRNGPQIDTSFIEAKAQQIITKLWEFWISVSLQWYNIWPSVVQIMVTPATGVKISTIESHKDDMMLWLKTKSLRIIAPIPGTDSVGIEIPNPHPQMIRLHELIGSQEFIGATKDNSTNISLGKGIDGKLVVKSLEKMPHLLVAGATGQGKSVWLNDFILSLMIQNTPDQIKFVMVDPKQVEMEMYSWLPYQLCPIITDPEQALKALKRCAIEMDERYTILKNARVKNLAEYTEKTGEHMYRIVIVIDELADLMMTGKKKDVEMVIARIAQKARAVGIHLILATQRPSVNVITGLIKANIPCRVSFGVVSQIDSRTILDQKGAEDLVGKWDMLYLDTTMKHPIRVQAPFVDTKEIDAIVGYLKDKYMNNIDESEIYHPQLMEILERWSDGGSSAYAELLWWWDDDDDALMRQAMDVIADSRRASTTQLQKKLSIWFARASRIMDMLEERGIVGPQEGSKPREVLI
jgi:DNA segregation ATPase FtsK/SpoIIIE, S-DNA-T family